MSGSSEEADFQNGSNDGDNKNIPTQLSSSSSIPEPVQRCIFMLKHASSDTEKFAALLMITKLIKSDDLVMECRRKLLEAIGLGFIGRLLGTKDVPDGCPPFMFKSIALTVLACFVSTCHGDPALHRLIPLLGDILSNPDLYEDDLAIIKEAYQCLCEISSETSGRKALIDFEIIGTLVDSYIAENLYHEHALEIIRQIAVDKNCKMWDDEPEAFSKLMDHLCKDFAVNQNEQKFILCEVLADLIPSMVEDFDRLSNEGSWKPLLHKGLSDILFSKLSQDLRNKGLNLASVVLEMFGAPYIVSGGEKGRQLLLLMVHLACIEVRMSLEDKTFQESVSLAVTTTACYSIIEEAIKFLINGAIDLEEKQKQQLYAALKGAFNGVLEFLNGASMEDVFTSNMKNQMFTCASVRVLGAWLAEETSANKDEVYQILPFLIKLAKHNFDHNNSITTKAKKKAGTRDIPLSEKREKLPDLLRFLLPGLCHLTAEDTPRQILLDIDIENLLLDYLLYHWNSIASMCSEDKPGKIEVFNNADVMITICNIFMNIIVQEPSRVKTGLLYYRLLKFIFSKVPEIPADNNNLQLTGSFCTLGLMIFRHQYMNIQKTELSIFRFIQATVRFLWDGYNVEESTDYATLVVSAAYEQLWSDLVELWFLSIHTLTLLLPNVPWICSFLVESEWPQTIIETFLLVKDGGIEAGVKSAYEDFLCMLVQSSKGAKEIMLIKGIKTVCKNHSLQKLTQSLNI